MHKLFLVYFVRLHVSDPPLGGTTPCIQQLVCIIILVDCCPGWIGIKNNLCIKLVFLYTIISRCTVNKT